MKDHRLITPAQLVAELKRIGYVEIDPEGPSGATWVDPSRRDRPAVLVPHESAFAVGGYVQLLESALERLSWAEEISVSKVIDRLSDRGDRFEMRIVDASTVGGRLPVRRAPGVVEGFLQVLRGGARAQFRGARASYPGGDPDDVVEALDGIELMPPEAGSFRLLAVSARQAQLPLDRETALPEKSRLVVASALRCLAAAAVTTSEEPEKAIANLPDAIAHGVSTTLLQGLEAMTEDAPGAAVEFTVNWDLQLPPVDSPTAVRLEPPQLQRVPRLTRELRQHEPEEHRVVSGWVKTASADELIELGGRATGQVVVETRIEGRLRDVRIELPPELFEQARPGRTLLTAQGTLQRIKERWHLVAPHSINLHEP
jgi:hypothetical protein